MSRTLAYIFSLLALIVVSFASERASAQTFGAFARAVQDGSEISDGWFGKSTLQLELSGGVPWRVYTVSAPDRIVIDFREVDFAGFDLAGFDQSDAITEVFAGPLRAGWSRMVVQLAEPMAIAEAAMETDTSGASLSLTLAASDRAAFDAVAGAPNDPSWAMEDATRAPAPTVLPDVFTVVIDPGHGGIDPGAIRKGFEEADLVLQLALELEEALIRAGGVNVVLTRRDDVFVSLERRIALAAQAGAHVFVSLHADAIKEGIATGAAVFTLSDTAGDEAGIAMVERHKRGDLLAGLDLSTSDDEVAQVLMDLARHDTDQRSDILAEALVQSMAANDLKLHKKPKQKAGFSVLKSPGIPSILVEAGFLSTDEELDKLRDPAWRKRMAGALRDGLFAWALADRAVAPLRRK